jgi:hypothetical protein
MVSTTHDPTRPVDHEAFERHVAHVAAVVRDEYAGDLDAYFTANARAGLKLTPTGWQQVTHPEPGLGWGHPAESEFAATDYRVLRRRARAAGRVCDHEGKCNEYCHPEPVSADGIWVDEYDESDEPRISTQIGRDPFTREAPGPDAEPVLVLGDFHTGAEVFWPEAVWFDRRQATFVCTGALACDHEVEYEDEGAKRRVEVDLWSTADGYWVGRLTNPAALNDRIWGPDDEVWCVVDERYAAHLLWHHCEQAIPSVEAQRLPLVRLIRYLEDASYRLTVLSETHVELLTKACEELIAPRYPVGTDISASTARRRWEHRSAAQRLLARIPSA